VSRRGILVDTAVFVYARGTEHPYRAPCRRIVAAVAQGDLELQASTEMVQEFAHLLRRRDHPPEQVRAEALDVAETCVLHAVEPEDLRRALDLLVNCPTLHVRDAVHAATALRRGLDVILSPDRAFDAVPGLTRLDPASFADEFAD
jgi:predicted nucleic acid-binding protein